MSVEYRGKVRSRPTALDGEHSWDAAKLQTESRSSQIKAVIVELLTRYGPLGDEELFDRYEAHRFMHGDVPAATPQNVRTRRHELHIEGRVSPTGSRVPTRAGATAALWQVNE